ncbi:alkaline phosphatase [Flagellimonas zhangzhouensis]|uniref:Alkaline phosphatase n=1 Tax=Flagellimonas zhangzhouensis TaxID=1073328 RepID=A0A1H2Z925_9FLAO|nr:alkaline phosphatase [Allomuricauda zhangzhouensis]SDR07557.1 alkaline phosphatase [Allomuricauda zhangzhouensis]SDX13354.1 alkaline phosphatase [Allomuricauda zhangzhouensis]
MSLLTQTLRKSSFLSWRHVLSLIVFLVILQGVYAQSTYKIHSHNDYAQELPFWFAYSNGASSIEADLFLKDNVLYVTHAEDEINPKHTFKKLYLDRLQGLEADGELGEIQLLIDLKSEAYTTLAKLVKLLGDYPTLIESGKVKFVISGNRPEPGHYKNYPDFIWFDHQNLEELNRNDLTKVALVSVSFKNYSVWNGYGRMTAPDLEAVTNAIEKAKSAGKPFRFWATPDTKTAWARLAKMGVDYINTDHPALAKQYLDKLDANTFHMEQKNEVYAPKFLYDEKSTPKNIILMIGDGNGLAQISSAMIANRGNLTVTGLKNIGLVKIASADDLITDSAAGASAMATGTKTNNRAIGVDPKAKAMTNLVDVLGGRGYNTAIVTTDAIFGATPSSFYAHRIERDDTPGLIEDLNKSQLDFFIAGGKNEKGTIDKVFTEKTLEIFEDFKKPTAIYLGDNKAPTMENDRGGVFPSAIRKSLEVLESSEAPFLLMVEGAQIDNGGHSNSTKDIVQEMLDFDLAIAEALKFADANKNTLVVITADHETSGFGIVGGSLELGTVQGDFLTVDHTGIMVPLFAYGPQADNFSGVYENTEIFEKILEALDKK